MLCSIDQHFVAGMMIILVSSHTLTTLPPPHTHTHTHTHAHAHAHAHAHTHTRARASVNRCFRCSGYNHRHTECRNEEACPICVGKHKLKDCAALRSEYKCINCERFNAHNQERKTQTKHSSLDRNCPSLQAMIAKYRQNTNY